MGNRGCCTTRRSASSGVAARAVDHVRPLVEGPAARGLLPNRWTELFFLDEATALRPGIGPARSAGGRATWSSAPRGTRTGAGAMRGPGFSGGRDRSRAARGAAGRNGKKEDVPRGAVVPARRNDGRARGLAAPGLAREAAALELRRLRPRSEAAPEEVVNVLTPRSIVGAIRQASCRRSPERPGTRRAGLRAMRGWSSVVSPR